MIVRLLVALAMMVLPTLSLGADANPNVAIDQFLKIMEVLRSDPQIIEMLSSDPAEEDDLPSLRQFRQAWKRAPKEVDARARQIAGANGSTLERFIDTGDEILCSVSKIDQPGFLSDLSKQVDEELEIEASKQVPVQTIEKLKDVKEQIQFCQSVSIKFFEVVSRNEKRIRDSLNVEALKN